MTTTKQYWIRGQEVLRYQHHHVNLPRNYRARSAHCSSSGGKTCGCVDLSADRDSSSFKDDDAALARPRSSFFASITTSVFGGQLVGVRTARRHSIASRRWWTFSHFLQLFHRRFAFLYQLLYPRFHHSDPNAWSPCNCSNRKHRNSRASECDVANWGSLVYRRWGINVHPVR